MKFSQIAVIGSLSLGAPLLAIEGGREPRADEFWARSVCTFMISNTPTHCGVTPPGTGSAYPMPIFANGVLIPPDPQGRWRVLAANDAFLSSDPRIARFKLYADFDQSGNIDLCANTHHCGTSALVCPDKPQCGQGDAATEGPFWDVKIIEVIPYTGSTVIAILDCPVPECVARPLPVSFMMEGPWTAEHQATAWIASWGGNGGQWKDCDGHEQSIVCGDCNDGATLDMCCRGRLLVRECKLAFDAGSGLMTVVSLETGAQLPGRNGDSGTPIIMKDPCGQYVVIGMNHFPDMWSVSPSARSQLQVRASCLASRSFSYERGFDIAGGMWELAMFSPAIEQTVSRTFTIADTVGTPSDSERLGFLWSHTFFNNAGAYLQHYFPPGHVPPCIAVAQAVAPSSLSSPSLRVGGSGELDHLQVFTIARCDAMGKVDRPSGCTNENCALYATGLFDASTSDMITIPVPFTLQGSGGTMDVDVMVEQHLDTDSGATVDAQNYATASFTAASVLTWKILFDLDDDGLADEDDLEMASGQSEVYAESAGTQTDFPSTLHIPLTDWPTGPYVLEVRVTPTIWANAWTTECVQTSVGRSDVRYSAAKIDLRLRD